MIEKSSPSEKKWHELAKMVSRAKHEDAHNSLNATSKKTEEKTAKIALEKFAEKKDFPS